MIIQILKKYKSQLLVLYTYMLASELCILAQPYLLGKAIDGLLHASYFYLYAFAISIFISHIFQLKRMIIDTKIYTSIYIDSIKPLVYNDSMAISMKSARFDMAHEIVNLLEGYVHYYIATIVTVIGSITFIYTTNYVIGIIVTAATVLVVFQVYLFKDKIQQVIHIRNNNAEHRIHAMEQGNVSTWNFFQRRRKIECMESCIQGKNWFVLNSIKSVFLIMSIVILIETTDQLTPGDVLTIYSYVNNFLMSLMSIPIAMESYSRIKNVLARITSI